MSKWQSLRPCELFPYQVLHHEWEFCLEQTAKELYQVLSRRGKPIDDASTPPDLLHRSQELGESA